MILIDCTFVNSQGGINVLKNLTKSISPELKSHFILFLDYRLKFNKEIDNKTFETYYVKNNLLCRQVLFFKYRRRISVILSLGNIPLLFTFKRYQLTYNMQYFIFETKNIKSISKRYIWKIKSLVIKLIFKIAKTDIAVQTDAMKRLFMKKLFINERNIFLFPIFSELLPHKFNHAKHKFIYLSSGEKYKNVEFLLDAFIKHADLFPKSSLVLTISKKYKNLNLRIDQLFQQGYKIINKGSVNHENAIELLKKNYILVHPSEVESFGLVLVEASQLGNAIIAPNINYVSEICLPSSSYDLNILSSLIQCLNESSQSPLPESIPIIRNMSNELINHLYYKLN